MVSMTHYIKNILVKNNKILIIIYENGHIKNTLLFKMCNI